MRSTLYFLLAQPHQAESQHYRGARAKTLRARRSRSREARARG